MERDVVKVQEVITPLIELYDDKSVGGCATIKKIYSYMEERFNVQWERMIKRYKKNEIEKLVKILKNDGVISVPTDTVFGICARTNSERAHDKLITIKNRSIKKSFPVMCANEEQIKNIAIVNDVAKKLIKSFMPGPITLVLKKNKDLPEYVTNGKDTIAIRMATSETTKKLILELGSPIFMTSANQSGEPTCTSLDEIEKM